MAAWKACALCAIGDVCFVCWAVLVYLSRFRYADILKAADRELFPVPRLLKPGFAAMQRLPKNVSKGMQALSGKAGEPRMSPFEAYCAAAWSVGAGLPILSFGAFAAAVSGKPALLFCCLALALLTAYLPVYRFRNRRKGMKAEAERDLPAVISKTVLLNDAGLPFSVVWHNVGASADGFVYREMRRAEEQMKNGVTCEAALQSFADACGGRDAQQFVGLLIRQRSKGGDDIALALRALNRESWEGRKQRAKVKTAAASEAMLFPMLLIFIGILIMVIVPMLAGLQF